MRDGAGGGFYLNVMKNHIFFATVAAILAFSCTKEFMPQSQPEDGFTLAKISLGGDYVSISSDPLTKAETMNAYYAFEVDSLIVHTHTGIDETVWYDTTYFHYAEGLFDKDHINNLSVMLQNGHKYRIRCGIIKDQEDKLYVENGYVFEPFASATYSRGDKALITNSFVYGSEQTLWTDLDINCTFKIGTGQRVRFAKLDRYFGEAFSEGGAITIDMERWNFGLHLLINPPMEGTLKVYHHYSSPEFEYTLTPSSNTVNEEHVFALGAGKNTYTNTQNFASIYLKVEWTRANGETLDLSPQTIRAYNKTMTTIKVDVNDRIGGSDININTNDEMEKRELTIN